MNSSGHWHDANLPAQVNGASFFNSSAIQGDGHFESIDANFTEFAPQFADDPESQENSQSAMSHATEQPSVEQMHNLYYTKGLEELESLQLLDLSPLATWKLSSHKQGFGLAQLRNDSPNSFWQSDGSMGNNMEHQANTADGSQLSHPHYVTLQFSKRVSLERISVFTNYQLDESYTPLKIKIMAGGSNWDLTEVCVVTFDKPIGWSHIIFKGVRGDGLLKCFVVKIIVLANHQDGKDSHIRAIRCFGKKSTSFVDPVAEPEPTAFSTLSGILLNHSGSGLRRMDSFEETQEEESEYEEADPATLKILSNVSDVIGFNSGFDSLELKSVSSIR